MFGAPVPKAAIDENRYPARRERDVNGSSRNLGEFVLNPETQAPSMQRTAQGDFRYGARSGLCPHT